jgi:superfamily I DNA and/or RNA helicase
MDELKEEEGGSTSNEGEARVVLLHVRRLLEAGVSAADIGVITPYSAQVSMWKSIVRALVLR